MFPIQTILVPECAACVSPSSKKRLLESISQLAAKAANVDEAIIFEKLLERERVCSTGIGNGIAIPHARIDNIEKPIGVLIKCEQGIEFDAIDNKPVDIIFALLVPSTNCDSHLETLSQVAELLSDKKICKQIRQSQDNNHLFEVISQ